MPIPGLEQLVGPDPLRQWAAVLGGGAILLGAGFAIVRRLTQRRPALPEAEKNLSIDIRSLPASGPGDLKPRLVFQGVPVRLAVLVLAPSGRSGEIPPVNELADTVNQLVPEFMQVVNAHRPIFRRWPVQLSWQGFTQTFFSRMPLPGDRGRNSPWCCVAGRFDAQGQQLLVGMVLCAERNNSLTQVIVRQAAEWPTLLRVELA